MTVGDEEAMQPDEAVPSMPQATMRPSQHTRLEGEMWLQMEAAQSLPFAMRETLPVVLRS